MLPFPHICNDHHSLSFSLSLSLYIYIYCTSSHVNLCGKVAQQIAQQPEAAEAQALLEESEVVDGPADDLKKKPTAYVFEFKPDSEVSNLKELRAVIDMILASATTDDLVLFELESPGVCVPHCFVFVFSINSFPSQHYHLILIYTPTYLPT